MAAEDDEDGEREGCCGIRQLRVNQRLQGLRSVLLLPRMNSATPARVMPIVPKK